MGLRAFADEFNEHCGRAADAEFATAAGREVLEASFRDAQAAWPQVVVEPGDFAAHLATCLPKPIRFEGWASLAVADLYLACGCLHHDRAALAAFEQHLMRQVPGFVSKIERRPEVVEEVCQRVRQALFVGGEGGAAPKIEQYAGAAPLGGWLRVVAIRVTRNATRRQKPELALDDDAGPAAELLASAADPELDYLKQQSASAFREAFRHALSALPERERNVLALSVLDGLSSMAIGRAYGVQGATVRLWLKHARELLFSETVRRLTEKLNVSPSVLRSVIALARSRFDVTLSHLLRPGAANGESPK